MNEQELAPKDPKILLRGKDFLVNRAQHSLNASPFLALALEQKHLAAAQNAIQSLIRIGYSPRRLLQKFPNVTAWAICATLLAGYGKGTQEVWPIIGRLFGKDPTVPERTDIVNSFKAACRKMGLVTEGFDRNVDVFLIHVGVASGQLGHVAKAFLQQEAAHGLPSLDDVIQLNRWEDDAVLTFLPVGVHVPERPILHDETAWMAALFLQWRANPESLRQQSSFAKEFADVLDQVEKDVGKSGLLASQPSPRLVWLDGRPQLQIPAGAGRLTVNIGEQILRLRRGQTWPLPQPLPSELTWVVDGESRNLPLYNSSFVIFEAEDGRQLVPRKSALEWIVQTSAAMVTSSNRFSVEGIQAEPFGPDLYAAQVNLRQKPLELSSGSLKVKLRGSKRTRISIEGIPIAKQSGRGGSLWSSEAHIVVEAALYSDRNVTIKAECAGASAFVHCELDADGIGCLPIKQILSSLEIDITNNPVRLLLTMMRSAEGKSIETRIKREIFVWPSYTGLDGVRLMCNVSATNFVSEASKHVLRDDSGNLCLDRKGGYENAIAAFEIDAKTRQFLIDWPETSIVWEKTNGTRHTLALGSVLTLGGDDWNGSLVVRSPDRRAALMIAGRHLERPFVNTGSWAIPLRQLDKQPDNHIFLLNGTSRTLLARIETVAAPRELVVNHRADGVSARISVPFPIGGALISVEDECGEVVESELTFDHFPADIPADNHIGVKKSADDAITITLSNSQTSEYLSLCDISLREMGNRNWTRLSTRRGDRISLAIPASDLSNVTVDRMERVDRWVSQCFSVECWDGGLGKILINRWADIVRALDNQPGGRAAILRLAHSDEDDPNWLPMKHVIEVIPNLHSADAIDFVALGTADTQAGKALSLLGSLSQGQLRDNSKIDPRAFLGFENFQAANATGEELTNFSTIRLITFLQMLGPPRAFWDGKPVLGPEHRHAAMTDLIERCEDYRLFSEDVAEGRMSLRSARLNQLMHVVIKSGPKIPEGAEHNDQAYLLWIDQMLMAYAAAARRKKTTDFFSSAAQETGFSLEETKRIFGELLRLGPELLSFHLLCQELERLRP